MWSRRTATIIVAAFLMLVPPVRSIARAELRADRPPSPAAGAVALSHQSIPASGPVSVSPFEPWKVRRKAVLEDSDSRVPEEVDLGPVLIPNRVVTIVRFGPITRRRVGTVPLRC
jgi:hypothetical protein